MPAHLQIKERVQEMFKVVLVLYVTEIAWDCYSCIASIPNHLLLTALKVINIWSYVRQLTYSLIFATAFCHSVTYKVLNSMKTYTVACSHFSLVLLLSFGNTFKKTAEISIFGLFWMNRVSGIALDTWLMRYSCMNIESVTKKQTKKRYQIHSTYRSKVPVWQLCYASLPCFKN